MIGGAVVVGAPARGILDLPIKGTPPIVRRNDIKLIALFKEPRFRTTLSHWPTIVGAPSPTAQTKFLTDGSRGYAFYEFDIFFET